jgi:hypothetical protein
MALDSRQKRAAIVGTARIWYRNPHPSSIDAAQRASIGMAYPVALFEIEPTWTLVSEQSTSWSIDTEETTIWTEDTEESTVWTEITELT